MICAVALNPVQRWRDCTEAVSSTNTATPMFAQYTVKPSVCRMFDYVAWLVLMTHPIINYRIQRRKI